MLKLLNQRTVFLFTGHLIDSVGRAEERFPYHLLNDARSALKTEIESITQAHKPQIAISSLAAGGDLIFAQEMLDSEIPLAIFLPFEIEKFLSVSVTYEKSKANEDSERWALRFYNIIRQAQETIITSSGNDTQEDALRLCNERMLAYALERSDHNPQKVLAFALVKPNEKGKKGGATEFIKLMEARNVCVKKVWP